MRIQPPPYRLESLLAAVVFAAAAAAPTFAAGKAANIAPVPGEWWESTVQMSMAGMEGMHMPPMTTKFCRPKNAAWNDPPPMDKKSDCKVTDQKATPNHLSWKMACTNPQMTGSGEMTTSGPDGFSGTIAMTMAQGAMNMKMSGRRVGGDCDAEAPRRQVVEMLEKGEAAKVQMCKEEAGKLDFEIFSSAGSPCTDPADKADLCRRLGTMEGYKTVAGNLAVDCSAEKGPSERMVQAAAFCGTTVEALRNPLCEEALKNESLEFLGSCCPVQAQPLAQKECAGRKYTDLAGTKYGDFCGRFAADQLATKPPEAPQPAADQNEAPAKKKKNIFKGLFGK